MRWMAFRTAVYVCALWGYVRCSFLLPLSHTSRDTSRWRSADVSHCVGAESRCVRAQMVLSIVYRDMLVSVMITFVCVPVYTIFHHESCLRRHNSLGRLGSYLTVCCSFNISTERACTAYPSALLRSLTSATVIHQHVAPPFYQRQLTDKGHRQNTQQDAQHVIKAPYTTAKSVAAGKVLVFGRAAP